METKDFNTLVAEQVAAIQGGSSNLLDTTVGSILRAVVEAYSAVAMWLQSLVLNLLAMTRAATSSGADLDSWVGDFGVTRIGAEYADGMARFARYTATSQAVVPVGSIAQTRDGSQQYSVQADATQSTWNADLNGYVLPPGITSVLVPVQALLAGADGNAVSGAINTIGSAIPGIDTVTNETAITSGSDAETDPELRARFIQYIASLSKATKGAIGYAVSSSREGLTYQLFENQNYDGSERLGFFFVVVDDGSGQPTEALISSLYNAIEAVRGFTIVFAVFSPVTVTADVVMSVATAPGYDHDALAAQVKSVLAAHINALGLGNPLAYTSLSAVAYGVSPAITNVTGILLNGGSDDITVDGRQTIKAGTVQVT
jgi:uncharacterized phage protein gp47/JayE